MIKKIIAVLSALALVTGIFTSCGKIGPDLPTEVTAESTTAPAKEITTGEIGVIHDTEFDNVYIDLTIDEFNALGFEFGDSVNVEFDNGEGLEDIPYYSGYYVPVGQPLACGYPGYPHVIIARNYGESTWKEFEMTESSKVTVTLNQKGKYKDVQELYALQYSDERSDYDSDVMFANFREVTGGNIKEKMFYRSASPCDNQHNRASYANAQIEKAGVKFALNLSDNEEKYKGYVAADDFDSDYYNSLYESGDVLLLAMNANYRSDDFARIISEGLLEMTNHDGPCDIHCVEGKDRTGFVCALILALAGASADEIIDDYMITYYNYYRITKEDKPEKYEAILGNVRDFFYCICEAEDGADIRSLDLKAGAENYLRRGGLNDSQIARIEEYINK